MPIERNLNFYNSDEYTRLARPFFEMNTEELEVKIVELETALEKDHSDDTDWNEDIQVQIETKLESARKILESKKSERAENHRNLD